MPIAPLRRAIARKFAVEPRAAHYLHRDRLWLCHAGAMMASGIGLHIPGSKRPDDEEEGEEGEEPSLLGPGLLGKLDPTSRKKLDKPADIQFQDPKVINAAISLQRVCRPVKQGPSFFAQWWQPLPARGRVLLSPPAPPPGPSPHSFTDLLTDRLLH